MSSVQATWNAWTTNAWPAEISIPIVVTLCTVCYAIYGWLSVVPMFLASGLLVTFISYVGLRRHLTDPGISFFEFLWSRPKPQYVTYQMRSSQLYVPQAFLKNLVLFWLISYILGNVFNWSAIGSLIAPIYMIQVGYFMYDAIIGTWIYFWNPGVSWSGTKVSTSQPARSKSPKADQFQDLEDYEYTPFDSERGFRLLLLKNGSGQSPLEGELIAQSTKTIAIFTALSYTWDSQPLDRYILCGGRRLAITANCEAALRRLRWRYRGRLLWVDAICIHQKDDDERAQQIPIMDRIYGHATEVAVWLGEGTKETEIGFKYMRLWVAVSGLGRISDSLGSSLRKFVVEKIRDRAHQKCIFEIAQRPWFRRVWTLQEITLARPNCVSLYCGNDKTEYDMFLGPFALLMSNMIVDRESPLAGHISNLSVLNLRFELRDSLRFGSAGDSAISLRPSRILAQIRACEATDKRDKVYALYALFREIGMYLPKPNYSKNTGEIYRETAISAMNHEQSLDIMLLLSGKRVEGEPSWVPDFNETISPTNFLTTDFAATGSFRAYFPIPDDGVIIRVRGRILDEVLASIDGPQRKKSKLDIGIEDETFLSLSQGFQETINMLKLCLYFCYGHSESQYAGRDGKFHASLDVLSRGVLKVDADKFPFECWSTFLTIIDVSGNESRQQLDSWVELGKRRNTLWQRFFDDPKLKHLTEIDDWKILFVIKSAPKVELVHMCILETLSGNRLFWTKSGYLGHGSVEIRHGDVIALIEGLRMPMILRPSSSGSCPNLYSVVSPAYISGMMNGELWEGAQEQLSEILLE